MFLVCVVTSGVAAVQETPGKSIEGVALTTLLDELEQSLGAITSLRTQFRQEKHLSIFLQPVEAKGILFFAQPQSVRFEIVEPYRSVLITNAKSVAQFEHVDGQWKKLRTGGAQAIRMVTGQIALWLQGDLRGSDDAYTITAEHGDTTVLHLVPSDEDFATYVSRIDIILNDDHSDIVQLEIHEPNEDFTRIVFESSEKNVALDDAVFRTSGRSPSPTE